MRYALVVVLAALIAACAYANDGAEDAPLPETQEGLTAEYLRSSSHRSRVDAVLDAAQHGCGIADPDCVD